MLSRLLKKPYFVEMHSPHSAWSTENKINLSRPQIVSIKLKTLKNEKKVHTKIKN